MGANGQAVFTTTAIGPGHHIIIASYGGDATYLASTANTVTEQIDELRILRVGNNNTNILPGTTVVYTIQVDAASGHHLPVQRELCGKWTACGSNRHASIRRPWRPAAKAKTHDDGDHRKHCVEHATAVPLPRAAACAGTFASLFGTQRAQAVAEDSPIPGSGAAGGDSA